MHSFDLSVTNESLICWASLPVASPMSSSGAAVHHSHRHYPVLRRSAQTGQHELSWMREGLIPSYAHDETGATERADAHAESLSCTSCFRSAFRRRRCIIPADLMHVSPNRNSENSQSCSLALASGEIFGLAGIWETWFNDQGHAVETFAVISTRSQQGLSPMLERIPIVLAADEYDRWLQPTVSEQPPFDLLRPLSIEQLHSWRLMPFIS